MRGSRQLRSRRGSAALALVSVVLLAAPGVLATAQPAAAGTYKIWACDPPQAALNAAGLSGYTSSSFWGSSDLDGQGVWKRAASGFTPLGDGDVDPGNTSMSRTCSSGTTPTSATHSRQLGIRTTGSWSSGQNAEWTAVVPSVGAGSAVEISGLRAWGRVDAPTLQPNRWGAYLFDEDGISPPYEAICEQFIPGTPATCPSGAKDFSGDGSAISMTPGLSTKRVSANLQCVTPGGCAWATGTDLELKGLELTLAESIEPSVATLSGGLVSGGGPRWSGMLADPSVTTGSLDIDFSATDADSGVEQVRVEVVPVGGGSATTVASRSWAADPTTCPRRSWSACQTSRTGTVTSDLSGLPNGNYKAQLVVADAAGEFTVGPQNSGTITVENNYSFSYPGGGAFVLNPGDSIGTVTPTVANQTPVRFEAVSGLPDGVRLDSHTGVLSGAPVEPTDGPAEAKVRMVSDFGRVETATLSFDIRGARSNAVRPPPPSDPGGRAPYLSYARAACSKATTAAVSRSPLRTVDGPGGGKVWLEGPAAGYVRPGAVSKATFRVGLSNRKTPIRRVVLAVGPFLLKDFRTQPAGGYTAKLGELLGGTEQLFRDEYELTALIEPVYDRPFRLALDLRVTECQVKALAKKQNSEQSNAKKKASTKKKKKKQKSKAKRAAVRELVAKVSRNAAPSTLVAAKKAGARSATVVKIGGQRFLVAQGSDGQTLQSVSDAVSNQPGTGIPQIDSGWHAFDAAVPNDPDFAAPDGSRFERVGTWGWENHGQHGATPDVDIDAPEAWGLLDSPFGAKPVTVGVIDTGVDQTNPELAGRIDGCYRATGPATTEDGCLPSSEHGTEVTGAAIAGTDNGVAGVGTAPGARVAHCRATDTLNRIQPSWIAACLVRLTSEAERLRIGVINISLGSYNNSELVAQAVLAAQARDILIVAAAGNEDTSEPTYPAALSGVVAVSAINQVGEKASFSNYGSYISFAAPGVDMLVPTVASTDPQGRLERLVSGTSIAAPIVAATAALAQFAHQTKRATVSSFLAGTVRDLGPTGRDEKFGYGLINLCGAIGGVGVQCESAIKRRPRAELKASVVQAAAGRSELVLDASGSFDVDGAISRYQFAFAGRTVTSSSPVARYKIADASDWRERGTASVIVTDSEGLDAQTELTPLAPVAYGEPRCKVKLERNSANVSCDIRAEVGLYVLAKVGKQRKVVYKARLRATPRAKFKLNRVVYKQAKQRGSRTVVAAGPVG